MSFYNKETKKANERSTMTANGVWDELMVLSQCGIHQKMLEAFFEHSNPLYSLVHWPQLTGYFWFHYRLLLDTEYHGSQV